MCFGEERQKIRSALLCSCGTIGSQALVDLLDPFLRLSLVCQRPAAQDSTTRPPVRKSLFRGEADGGFGALLGGTAPRGGTDGTWQQQLKAKPRLKGCALCCARVTASLAPRQPLVRIAQIPQRPGVKAVANHPSVLPIEERRGAVLLGIVEGYPLRKVRVRSGYRSQLEQCRPQGTVRRHEHGSVLGLAAPGSGAARPGSCAVWYSART